MTVSYWEMVGTMIAHGVLHPELFFDHTGEDVVTWERCKSWIAEARADLRPTYLYQFESMVEAHLEYREAHQRRAHREGGEGAEARSAAEASAVRRRALTVSSTFGQLFRVTTFGESHGPAVGVVVDGMPPGIAVDAATSSANSTAAGRARARSPRSASEADQARSCRAVRGPNARHADRDAGAQHRRAVQGLRRAEATCSARATPTRVTIEKYGVRDHRGGGRSSGRETVGRVAAGALAKAALATVGRARSSAARCRWATQCATRRDWDEVEKNPVRCPDREAAAGDGQAIIERARDDKDSVGGVVEVVARGVPAGWGDPTMEKLDARLGAAMLSIPATKGVEIGGGFAMSARRGSETNDVFDGEPASSRISPAASRAASRTAPRSWCASRCGRPRRSASRRPRRRRRAAAEPSRSRAATTRASARAWCRWPRA